MKVDYVKMPKSAYSLASFLKTDKKILEGLFGQKIKFKMRRNEIDYDQPKNAF